MLHELRHSDTWKQFPRFTRRLLGVLILVVGVNVLTLSCEEPEPDDPRFSLQAPSLLAVTPLSDTKVELRWKNNEQHAEEIVILRKALGTPWRQVAVLPVTEITHVDSGLGYNITYQYTLQSRVGVNYSEFSNSMEARTAFVAPVDISYEVLADTSVRISWSDDYNFEKGYILQRGEEDLAELGPDTTEYIDNTLRFGVLYSYRVSAFTDINTSGWTVLDSVQTEFPAPTLLTVTPQTDSEMLLDWEDNSEFEQGFRIERNDGGGFGLIAVVSADSTEYFDSGLEAGTDYVYRVAAFTNRNQSDWATSVATSTLDLTKPYNVSVTPIQDSRIQLDWEDFNAIEEGFYLERDNGNGFARIAELMSSETSYTDTGLTYGVTYIYRIAAYTSANVSEWLTTSAYTTFFPTPTAISTAAVNDAVIQIEWRDNCSFETGYRLERDSGNGYALVAELGPDAQAYVDTGLAFNVIYTYRVAAKTAHNISSWLVSSNVATEFPRPTNLSAYSADDSRISLEWEDNTGFEQGFRLERNTGEGYVLLTTLEPNTTTYQDTALSTTLTYRYRVAAYTTANQSEYASSLPLSTTFPQPTSLNAFPVDGSQIRLQWSDHSTFEDGFYIERTAGSGFVRIDTMEADVVEYLDSGLEQNVYYTYRVAAFTRYNTSSWSTSGTVTTDAFPPPYNLTVTPTDDAHMLLEWVEYNELETGFVIERSATEGSWVEAGTVGENQTFFIDSDLSYGPVYSYRVAATTNDMQSQWALGVPTATVFPGPSFLLVDPVDDSQIDLSWDDNCDFETGYLLERNMGSGFETVATLDADVTEYRDTGLQDGVALRYRIAAITTLNTSDYIVSGTVQTTFPAPSSLVAEAISDHQIQLTWFDNTSYESGFVVERDAGSGYSWLDSLDSDVTEFIDNTAVLGTTYRYRVAAFTAVNASDYAISAATETLPITAPTNLVVNPVSDVALRVSWQDNCAFEAGFLLERDSGAGFAELATLAADSASYLDEGLSYGTDYTYRVRAFTDSSDSEWLTGEASTTAFPDLPGNPTASAIDDQQIRITWSDDCSFETGYLIERNSGAGWSALADLPANTTTYVDGGLLYGEIYYQYRLATYTTENQTGWVAINPVGTIFPVPTNVTATPISDANIQLSWTDNSSSETGFVIERDDGTGFVEIAQVVADVTLYTDQDLDFGVNYIYRVAAFSDLNQSGWGTSNTSTTAFPGPSYLNATAQSDVAIALEWDDNYSFESGFYVERAAGVEYVRIDTLPPGTTTYTDTDLNFGTYYTYRVAAYTTGNISNWAVSPTLTTNFPGPSNITVTALNDAELEINWTDNSTFEDGFILERSSSDGSSALLLVDRRTDHRFANLDMELDVDDPFTEIADLAANVTTYTDTALSLGTQYTYRVAAYTDQNISEFVTGTSAATEFDAPSGLAAEPVTDSRIDLTWFDNSDFEDGFYVERSTGGNFLRIDTLAVDAETYSDTGLTVDVIYSYRVAAFTNYNVSGFTNSSGTTTLYSEAPTNLVVTPLSDQSMSISWTDESEFEIGYLIERDNGAGFAALADLDPQSESYTDTGLDYGDTWYRYRVASYTTQDTSSWVTSEPYATVFPSPSGLEAQGISDTQIRLSWTDNTNFEAGFVIERDDGSGFVEIATVLTNVTQYTDPGLEFGTEYIYRVAAYTSANNSDWITSGATSTIFPGPTFLTATPLTDASIALEWDDNYSFESGFTVERSVNGGAFAEITTRGPGVTDYTDTGLTFGVSYTYRVAAYTADNTSNYATSSATQTTFPQPTGLTATAVSDAQINLSWTDNCSFETGYKIQRNTGSGWSDLVTLAANATSHSDGSLTLGVNYTYRVAAITASSTSDYVTSSATQTYFDAPTGLTSVAQNDHQITLTWTDNCSFETSYKVQRNSGSGFFDLVSLPANSTNYTDSGLDLGTSYTYRVAAATAGNTSDYVTGGAVQTYFDAPTNITVVATSDTDIEITWTDNCSFESGYRLERSSGGSDSQLYSLAANTTNYTDGSATLGITYTYRVAGTTANNTSDYATSSSVATSFPGPDNFTVIPVSDTEADLSWTDNSDFEDGFEIWRDDGNGFGSAAYATVGANVTSYSATDLEIGEITRFKVRAYTAANESDFTTSLYSGWVVVPAGPYTYGEDATVTFDLDQDYLIMQYEVTNAQYAAYLNAAKAATEVAFNGDTSAVIGDYDGDISHGAGSYTFMELSDHVFQRISWDDDAGEFVVEGGYDNHPVVEVSWFGAWGFADHYDLRLPTEAEWEKAARGDTGYEYPWGDTGPDCSVANFIDCGSGGPLAIGQTTGESPFGAYDMCGNVWEWTYDTTANRVLRGGGFNTSATGDLLKTWFQYASAPSSADVSKGFRCVYDQ